MKSRREVVSAGIAAVGGLGAAGFGERLVTSRTDEEDCPDGPMLAVFAELQFAKDGGNRAAGELARLAAATQREPGCLRYVVARDLADDGRFHLSELWKDEEALAAHFSTPHMAAFSAAAREIGYAAPFMKRISVDRLENLNPSALRSTKQECP